MQDIALVVAFAMSNKWSFSLTHESCVFCQYMYRYIKLWQANKLSSRINLRPFSFWLNHLLVRNKLKYSTGNIAITMYCARWVLEMSWATPCKVYDCLTTMLYTWHQYKIILKANCNFKKWTRKGEMVNGEWERRESSVVKEGFRWGRLSLKRKTHTSE